MAVVPQPGQVALPGVALKAVLQDVGRALPKSRGGPAYGHLVQRGVLKPRHGRASFADLGWAASGVAASEASCCR